MPHKTRAEEDLYVETGYKIIFEDEYFLAVDKPAPLPVHAVGRFKEKNLKSILEKDLKTEGLRIVNRLDSETSGIVLAAKTSEAAGKLGLLFENRQVHKEYRAVVLGIPEKKKDTILTSLGVTSERKHNIRVPDPQGQTAETDYEVLEERGKYSLLKVVPKTGRTHQIRAHLSFIGHPVAGDKIYIDPAVFELYLNEGWLEEMRETVKVERLLLHASNLKFRHPFTGQEMDLESALPALFRDFLA